MAASRWNMGWFGGIRVYIHVAHMVLSYVSRVSWGLLVQRGGRSNALARGPTVGSSYNTSEIINSISLHTIVTFTSRRDSSCLLSLHRISYGCETRENIFLAV